MKISEPSELQCLIQIKPKHVNPIAFAIRPLYSLRFKSLKIQNKCHNFKVK